MVETRDKSGKIKFTFEVEINQAAMELARTDIDVITDVLSQNMPKWRENMMWRRKEGQGHAMITHHGYHGQE